MNEEQARALQQQQPSDLRTFAKLVIYAVLIMSAAAVLGVSVRIFIVTSGFGG